MYGIKLYWHKINVDFVYAYGIGVCPVSGFQRRHDPLDAQAGVFRKTFPGRIPVAGILAQPQTPWRRGGTLASRRDAGALGDLVRWCRFAQPPATGWVPSGNGGRQSGVAPGGAAGREPRGNSPCLLWSAGASEARHRFVLRRTTSAARRPPPWSSAFPMKSGAALRLSPRIKAVSRCACHRTPDERPRNPGFLPYGRRTHRKPSVSEVDVGNCLNRRAQRRS